MSHQLDSFFWAKSVAVVGASSNETKTGHIILKNLINSGFQGRIFPINPKAESILWLKTYPSLTQVNENVDLAVFTIPAAGLPAAIEDAGKAGVKAAIIITGGMGEIGNKDLEQDVLAKAAHYHMRVIGPNCQGIAYTHNSLCVSWPLTTTRGSIAVISQSGTIGAALTGWAQNDGIGASGFVSLGNKSDVNEIELLEYFADDPHTSVIALNIEGVSDGIEFIDACQKVTQKKPVVVLKPGRTEKGRQASASHTRSVAGDYEVFEAACRRAHLLLAKDVIQFYDYAKILALGKPLLSSKIAVITSSGGSGVLAVDCAEEQGLEMISLSEETKQELKAQLPSHCVVRNPLDLTGDTDAERYLTAASIIAKEAPGALLLIFGDPISGAAAVTDTIARELSLQTIGCYIGGGDTEVEETLKLQRLGYPVFQTPERAIAAIKALHQYGNYCHNARRKQSVCQ